MRLAALEPGTSGDRIGRALRRPPLPVHRLADDRRSGPPCPRRGRSTGRVRLRCRRARLPGSRSGRGACCAGGWHRPAGRAVGRARPGRVRRRHRAGEGPGGGARLVGRVRRRRVARRGPRPGRQGAGPEQWSPPAAPGRGAAGGLGPDPGHHVRRAGLPRARRVMVRTRRRPGVAVRQRGRVRGEGVLAGGRRCPSSGRRVRPAGPGHLVAGGCGEARAQTAARGRRCRPGRLWRAPGSGPLRRAGPGLGCGRGGGGRGGSGDQPRARPPGRPRCLIRLAGSGVGRGGGPRHVCGAAPAASGPGPSPTCL